MEGYDVVLANRGKRADPPIKAFFSKFFYRVFSYFLDMDYSGDAGNFRIISKKVVESCRQMREQFRFFGGLVAWLGYPTTSIRSSTCPTLSWQERLYFQKALQISQ